MPRCAGDRASARAVSADFFVASAGFWPARPGGWLGRPGPGRELRRARRVSAVFGAPSAATVCASRDAGPATRGLGRPWRRRRTARAMPSRLPRTWTTRAPWRSRAPGGLGRLGCVRRLGGLDGGRLGGRLEPARVLRGNLDAQPAGDGLRLEVHDPRRHDHERQHEGDGADEPAGAHGAADRGFPASPPSIAPRAAIDFGHRVEGAEDDDSITLLRRLPRCSESRRDGRMDGDRAARAARRGSRRRSPRPASPRGLPGSSPTCQWSMRPREPAARRRRCPCRAASRTPRCVRRTESHVGEVLGEHAPRHAGCARRRAPPWAARAAPGSARAARPARSPRGSPARSTGSAFAQRVERGDARTRR